MLDDLHRGHGGLDADAGGRRRRAPACSSSCWSTIRSTARSATRAASARCRISPTRSAPTRAAWNFRGACSTAKACKADVDFGPTLMLNRNRCILCTRCVRFMRDIDGDAQINIIDRGYGSEIATFQEEGVHSLLSGNLMDVCPVGAITTRDYRFKSRPWDNPIAADTICTLCAKGCNTTAWIKAKPEWAKGSRLIRFTPRFNPDVNGYWMCDIGRFDYHWIEGDDRAASAAGARPAALQQPVSWHDAIAQAVRPARARPARRTPTASASCSRRTRRTKSCSCSSGSREELLGDDGPSAISVTLARTARSRSRRTRSSRCRRSTRRTSTARAMLGLAPGAPATSGRGRHLARCAQAVEAGQVTRALRLRSRARRLARRHAVDRRGAHRAARCAAHRPGRAADRSGARRRFRAAGRIVRREGSVLHQRPGPAAGHRARDPAAGRSARRLADPGRTSARALGVPFAYTSAADVRARHRGAFLGGRRSCRGCRRWRSRSRSTARNWLQASNPSERWKWDFMYPGPAAGQRHGRPDVAAAAAGRRSR